MAVATASAATTNANTMVVFGGTNRPKLQKIAALQAMTTPSTAQGGAADLSWLIARRWIRDTEFMSCNDCDWNHFCSTVAGASARMRRSISTN